MDTSQQQKVRQNTDQERRIPKHAVIRVISKRHMSCELLGEAVILDLNKGIYYGLNEVGARVWALIQEPRTVGDICETILAEYDVTSDRCEQDVADLLQELARRELIEIHHAAAG